MGLPLALKALITGGALWGGNKLLGAVGQRLLNSIFGRKDDKKKQVEPQTPLLPASKLDDAPDIVEPGPLVLSPGGALLPQTTLVPELIPPSQASGGIDFIVAEIWKINQNLQAIRNAMAESARLEAEFRSNQIQDLEDSIADRDKLRSQKRNEKRRGNFIKNLPGAGTLKSFAELAGQGIGLELAAALLPEQGDGKNFLGFEQGRAGYQNQGWDWFDMIPDDWFNSPIMPNNNDNGDQSSVDTSGRSDQASINSNNIQNIEQLVSNWFPKNDVNSSTVFNAASDQISNITDPSLTANNTLKQVSNVMLSNRTNVGSGSNTANINNTRVNPNLIASITGSKENFGVEQSPTKVSVIDMRRGAQKILADDSSSNPAGDIPIAQLEPRPFPTAYEGIIFST